MAQREHRLDARILALRKAGVPIITDANGRSLAPPEVLAGDGWQNILTGLGLAQRDKRLGATFAGPTKLAQAELDRLYAGDWRVARVADRPAADAVRRWCDLLVDGERQEASPVLEAWKRLRVKAHFEDGIARSRLHGTAIAVLGIDDGLPMSEPVGTVRGRGVLWMQVYDRWDLSVQSYQGGEDNPDKGMPETYRVIQRAVTLSDVLQGSSPMAPVVHHTRTLRWDGVRTPLRRLLENGGFSDSVVARVYEVIRDYATAIGSGAHLVTDFAQATLKMQGLAAAMSEDNDGLITKRLQYLDMARSVLRLVPLDAEHEEFERKSTPVTGLDDLLMMLRDELCGAADMPEKILFGKATAGLGDQGQSDLEQYHQQIEGLQERCVVPQLTRLTELLMGRSGGTTGGTAEATAGEPNWSIQCCPLWTPDETTMSENRLRDAQADTQRITDGVLTAEEVRQARYGGDRYGTEITLDTELDPPDPADRVPVDPEDPNADPEQRDPDAPAGKLDPATTLNGAQITGAVDLIARAIAGEITVAAARVLLRVGLGLKPADVEAALEGIDQAIAAAQQKQAEEAEAERQRHEADLQAKMAGNQPPGPGGPPSKEPPNGPRKEPPRPALDGDGTGG